MKGKEKTVLQTETHSEQDRQELLNDLGPAAGPVRRIVGQAMQQDKDTRKLIVDTINKLEKI